jgi:hypothetical protein
VVALVDVFPKLVKQALLAFFLPALSVLVVSLVGQKGRDEH